jgi:hypothetical protein
VIISGQESYLGREPRYSAAPYLCRPLGVYGLLRTDQAQINRQVCDIEEAAIRTERGSRRKQQAERRPVDDPAKVAQPGHELAARVDHVDLIVLVGADPESVLVVDRDPVRAVDAVG